MDIYTGLLLISSTSAIVILIIGIYKSSCGRRGLTHPQIILINNINEPLHDIYSPSRVNLENTRHTTSSDPVTDNDHFQRTYSSQPSSSVIRKDTLRINDTAKDRDTKTTQKLSFLTELKTKHSQMDLSNHETFTNST